MATTTMASVVGDLPTDTLSTATVVLTKTYKYTMDVGKLSFACTLTVDTSTFGST